MRSVRRARRLAATLAAGALLLGACGYDATVVPQQEAEESAPAPAAEPVVCDDATESYRPSGDRAAAGADLGDEDLLVVGVSADTLRLGSANPFEGFEIQGFDIDVARAVATALGVDIRLQVISAADRIPLLESGEIDLVARNMTMNCARWEQIGFSAVYYNATQKVLVRADDAAAFEEEGVGSLDGKRVCAPTGSTSIDNVAAFAERAGVEIEAVGAANHTGCLIRFQNGEVDAITGDDTVLAGLAAQDPYAEVPEQESLSAEPYGLGANAEDVDLIRFVNSVLEERRSNGAWQRSYDEWLRPYLGPGSPPVPAYGR